ncbi:CU044_5270 family protein [Paenarthrobacter sp. NPDC057355]|uniref:CU044_5270 family protein n=1 Tax=Paenarthrobacter sp. NPDC057355 TaxID=3346105 RepID=UPI003645A6C5
MDDLQLLREMRSDIGSAPPATLARGRVRVMANIGHDETVVVRAGDGPESNVTHIRFRRRILLASAAAALIVGGIVVADVVRPTPGATAEAAEILNNAALATIRTSDPLVGPGQYLKVDTKAVYASTVGRDDGTAVSWLETTGGQMYIPADITGEWVWNREPRIPTTFFGEESRAEADKQSAPQDGPVLEAPQLVGILRGKAGGFYGGSPEQILGTPLAEAFETFPREPEKLLQLIYDRTKGKGPSAESEALTTIASALRTGVIPADLRAAMYKAAALIPGIVVADKQATLDGQQGVALGVYFADGKFRDDIIVDPETGQLIGERTVYLVAESGIPANTAAAWTSVRTSVVDSAP